jgi:hypothetical protein
MVYNVDKNPDTQHKNKNIERNFEVEESTTGSPQGHSV